MSNKPDRIVIQSRRNGPQGDLAWFKEIEQAILDGYRFADTGLRKDQSLRLFKGRVGQAVLFLEGKAPERVDPKLNVSSVKHSGPSLKDTIDHSKSVPGGHAPASTEEKKDPEPEVKEEVKGESKEPEKEVKAEEKKEAPKKKAGRPKKK